MEKMLMKIGKAAIYLILTLLFTGVDCFAGEKDDRLSLFSEFCLEYNDNIFGLSDSQISLISENDPDDVASGRFLGMDSLSDYILRTRIGIKWYPDWNKFTLTAWLQYNYFIKNSDYGYPEGRIIIKYPVGKKGAFIFHGGSIYGYEKKNYLSGFNDINENGNISRDERTYSAALYDEFEGQISYRYEIIDDKEELFSDFNIEPFAGYSTRSYNSVFDNRDKDTTFGGLGVELGIFDRINLELIYRHDSVSSPGRMEYILYDETGAPIDINGDGEIRENAPLYTTIDRSSKRDEIEINPSVRITKDISLLLGYSKLTSDYSSNNPLDADRYRETAYRRKYKSGISYELSKEWSFMGEYCKTKDEDPDDGSYSENSYMFTIKNKF